MKTFSRLSLFTIICLGFALMLVAGTAEVHAQDKVSLSVTGVDTKYEIDQEIEIAFILDIDGEIQGGAELRITSSPNVKVISGGISTTGVTGTVVVKAVGTSAGPGYIQANWESPSGITAKGGLAEFTIVDVGKSPALIVVNSPSNKSELKIGDTFTQMISIENRGKYSTLPLSAWQMDVVFNPLILEVVDVAEGDFLERDGEDVVYAAIIGSGRISVSQARAGQMANAAKAPSPAGIALSPGEKGELLTITFKILAVAEEALGIHNVRLQSDQDYDKDGTLDWISYSILVTDFVVATHQSSEPVDVNQDAEVHAQQASLTVTGDTGADKVYQVNADIETVFTASADGSPAAGATLTITHSGLTGVTISNGGVTNAFGTVIVRGEIISLTSAFIEAVWRAEQLAARIDLQVAQEPFLYDVAEQTARSVFRGYSTTFRHPDVHKFFPDVLRAFKDPEIQAVLNSVVIHHFVRDPEYIRAFYPDVDEGIIILLVTDNGFRTLFEDEGFQGVLQEPAEIDELVRLIEAQPPQEPGTLTIVSGDFQEGGPQTALGNPLVVLVRDQYGDALSGVDVTFRVTRGDGSLFRPTARTNRVGRAETTLTLASEPRIHQVEASVVGFPSLTQTFTAAAAAVCEVPLPSVSLPPKPTTLRIVSGNNQSGEVGEPLEPFIVGVLDQNGKPLEGIEVAFATLGGGQLSGHRIQTDVYGQALTTLMLGAGAEHHSVRASVSGITQTRTFTATAVAPPPPEEPEPPVPVPSSTEEPALPPMYWIAGNTIYHRPPGGEKAIFLEPRDGTLTGGLAVDMVGRRVYWTEEKSNGTGRVRSADLDGSNVETVKETITVPYDIAFDAKDQNLYWTNSRDKIQRINVDGSNFRGDFIVGLNAPNHIAFDVEQGRLYWTAAEGIWSIYVDNNTGIPRPLLGEDDLGKVRGIAVFDDVVYWTEQTSSGGRVRSMNRTGSGDKLLAWLEESIPGGIAVDAGGGKVYWTTSHGIQSARLTGELVVIRKEEPAGIALGGTTSEPAIQGAPSLSRVVSVENTLLANYPNPFNPETWIPYQLSASADVSVSIYAVDGRLVRRLDLGHQVAGVYRSRSRAAYWDGRNEFGERVASGLYFYTLTAGDFAATRKLLIRK